MNRVRPSRNKYARTSRENSSQRRTMGKDDKSRETAFFFDSRNSRLMQVADFASYAVYRWYEALETIPISALSTRNSTENAIEFTA